MTDFLRVCTGVFAMSFVLTGCDHVADFSDFAAVTIQRTGSFNLDMSPDYAFPLFTAPGEVLWTPGWEPFILNGDGYEEGTVWVTAGHGHTAYWYVAAYDTAARHAQYVRVTPGANTGIVDVQIESNGSGGSTVNVMYRLTGLSTAGNSNLEKSFSESSYAEMMEHWRSAIDENRDKIDEHFGSGLRPGPLYAPVDTLPLDVNSLPPGQYRLRPA